MKTLTAALNLISLFASSCTTNDLPVIPGGASMVVVHGTSFGECAGYCRTELTVRALSATFRRTTWRIDPPLPAKETTATLRADEWYAIVNSIDLVQLSRLDTIIGCPDCADGGAEWVEVTDHGYHKKVMFEFGKSLPYIQAMIDRLRAVEARFQSF